MFNSKIERKVPDGKECIDNQLLVGNPIKRSEGSPAPYLLSKE